MIVSDLVNAERTRTNQSGYRWAMARPVALSIFVLLLFNVSADTTAANWPRLLDRAPLNTDTELAGFPRLIGLADAYLLLALVLNLAVLTGLVYAFGTPEAALEYLSYVYLGLVVGSLLLSATLSPYVRAWSVLPIVALTIFLLVRFCDVPTMRAVLVTLLYHIYQVAYILAYRGIVIDYR